MMVSGDRKYSERLGVIRSEQLNQACARFDLGSVERAEPASAGLWGQNILLTTTAGEFVLRGNPTYPDQFRRERAVARAVHQHSRLAAPWPYLVDDDTDLFGWSYALMPLLPGDSGAVLSDSADDRGRVALAAAHGDALARLHQATFAASGPYDPAHDRLVAVDDYRSWTLERIESLRSLCRSVEALSVDDDRYIDELIESSASSLAQPFIPTLVHHDFSLANTTYEHSDSAYHATGVVDLGEAHIGDGDEDLVRFLWRRKREQRTAFVESYRRTKPARPGAADRLALYAVADLLFMWNVSHRGTNWFDGANFVDIAALVIGNARAAGVSAD